MFTCSSLVVQRVKDLVLSLQWLGSLLWCGFHPWPRNFHMLWVQPKSLPMSYVNSSAWHPLESTNSEKQWRWSLNRTSHFIYVNTFNPLDYCQSLIVVLTFKKISFFFLNGSMGELKFPRVPQGVNGRAGIWTWAVWLQSPWWMLWANRKPGFLCKFYRSWHWNMSLIKPYCPHH